MLEHENINTKIHFNSCTNDRRPNWRSKEVCSIHVASMHGLTETVEKLVPKYGGSPATVYAFVRDSPLHFAALNGHVETVKFLAKFTNSPNAPNDYGETPLLVAAVRGHLGVVKFLKSVTDTPNAPDSAGSTPIYEAARYGHLDVVKYLFHFTDNPNAPNPSTGLTPKDVAERLKHYRISKFLGKYTL